MLVLWCNGVEKLASHRLMHPENKAEAKCRTNPNAAPNLRSWCFAPRAPEYSATGARHRGMPNSSKGRAGRQSATTRAAAATLSPSPAIAATLAARAGSMKTTRPTNRQGGRSSGSSFPLCDEPAEQRHVAAALAASSAMPQVPLSAGRTADRRSQCTGADWSSHKAAPYSLKHLRTRNRRSLRRPRLPRRPCHWAIATPAGAGRSTSSMPQIFGDLGQSDQQAANRTDGQIRESPCPSGVGPWQF